ncbi:MAG: PGF-CTERM sorting domain-containing protein [Methanophagales archaeon]|nr:PGF-CTERM sorting domain-containing protein [Methanophagales archaeon]
MPAAPSPAVAVPTPSPSPTPTPPGFEAIFAITGMLAVAYLVLRRNMH